MMHGQGCKMGGKHMEGKAGEGCMSGKKQMDDKSGDCCKMKGEKKMEAHECQKAAEEKK